MMDARATDPRHIYGGAEHQAAESYWLEVCCSGVAEDRLLTKLTPLRSLLIYLLRRLESDGAIFYL